MGRRGRRGERDGLAFRQSYGVILVRRAAETDRPEVLLVRRRATNEFAAFVMGHYDAHDRVSRTRGLLRRMTADEKVDVMSLDFDRMWYRLRLSAGREEPYAKKYGKYFNTWIAGDGGAGLRRLVAAGPGETSAEANLWEFPKGRKASPRETDMGCALRELKEETGVGGAHVALVPFARRRTAFVDDGVRYAYDFFVAGATRGARPRLDLGDPRQLAEVSDVRWMDLDAVRLVDTRGQLAGPARAAARIVRRHERGRWRPLAPFAPPGTGPRPRRHRRRGRAPPPLAARRARRGARGGRAGPGEGDGPGERDEWGDGIPETLGGWGEGGELDEHDEPDEHAGWDAIGRGTWGERGGRGGARRRGARLLTVLKNGRENVVVAAATR